MVADILCKTEDGTDGVTSFLGAFQNGYHSPTGKRAIVSYLIIITALIALVGCPTALEPSDSAERNYDLEPPVDPGTTPPAVADEYDTFLQWTWSGSGGGTGYFRVRLNHNESWEEGVTSPWPNPAIDYYPGVYIFEVQERDAAGNWSAVSGEITTVKAREPTITTAPPVYSNNNQPSFEWSQYAPAQYGAADLYPFCIEAWSDGSWVAIEDLTGVLDPSALAVPLTGQGAYTASRALPDGEYRFCVAERNDGGARSDYATATFTVDTTPPAPPVISGPAAVSEVAPWQTYTWTSDPTDTVASYNWEFRDAGDAIIDSASGILVATATVPSGGITPPAGTYTLRVIHIDEAGNASNPGVFTIVVEQAPGLAYVGPSPTNDATPEFSVTGLNQVNLINEFQWLIDDAPQLPTFSNGAGEMWETFSQSTPNMTEGTHAVQVQQRRSDGSYADPSAAISVEIDLTAPPMPSFSATPPASTIDTQPSFTAQSAEVGVEFRYSVSGATTAGPFTRSDAGADGVETIVLPVLNTGPNTVTVSATDTAGNQSASNSFTVTVLETYPVTYSANGATGGSVPADQTKIQGTDLTLATNSGGLTRTGYTFTGWNTNATGTGASYPAGGPYGVDAGLTLYAEWSANTYTVTLDPAGGNGGTTFVIAYDANLPAVTAPTRTGFVFEGYYTGSGGTGTQYYTSTMTGTRTWDILADTTLYASWAYALGSPGPAGGTVFYDKGAYSNGWRYMEAAPRSTEWVDQEFGGYGLEVGIDAQNTAIGSGLGNTATIVAAYDAAGGIAGYAAELCDDFSYGGYSDWFLPSLNELNAMYQQFSAEYVAAGVTSYFWTSTEITMANAYAYSLSDWTGQPYGKAYLARVRAIRQF